MTQDAVSQSEARTVSGKAARGAAQWFNFGNIVAILVPVPLGLLWLGGSMLVYAMNRHHPNTKVGLYTQQAAYRFYAVTGTFVAAGVFIPRGAWVYYLVCWGLAALILIPWSIVDLVRIRRDTWEDTELPPAGEASP